MSEQHPGTAGATPTTTARPQQLRARRSPRLVALGVLLACLGGLGAGAAWTQNAETSQVVVMVNDVDRGEVVEATDLATTTIGGAPGVKTVPADQISALVGKQALSDLRAGGLVVPGSLGEPADQDAAVVGLRLNAGRIPQQSMPAGTKVLLVPVAASKAGAQSESSTTPATPIEASVVTAAQPLQDGTSWVIDVAVTQADAVTVAQLAAADQLVVVKKPRA